MRRTKFAWFVGSTAVLIALAGRGEAREIAFPSLDALPTTGPVEALAMVDMDGDGLTDVVTLENGTVVVTYARTPEGAFREPATFDMTAQLPANARVRSFAVGDAVSDGYPDVLLTVEGDWALYIFLGAEGGVFLDRVRINIGGQIDAFAWADFDGDLMHEIMCAVMADVYVVRLVGGRHEELWHGATPVMTLDALAVADFNGDGLSDFAATSMFDPVPVIPEVVYGLGNGDGTFAEPLTSRKVSRGGPSILYADAAGDAAGDILVYGGTPGFGILTGDGTGAFSSPVAYSAPGVASGMYAGDFDEDGKQDLLSILGDLGAVEVRYRRDDLAGPRYFLAAKSAYAAGAVVDVDEDGHLDCLAPALGGNLLRLAGAGDGNLGGIEVRALEGVVTGGTTGDFDGDGRTDAVAFCEEEGVVAWCRGTGQAPWFERPRPLTVAPALAHPLCCAAGDLNGDGRIDLVFAASASNALTLLHGNGDGTFKAPVSLPLPSNPSVKSVALGDFNNDGVMDIAATLYVNRAVAVLLGDGAGSYGQAATFGVGPTPTSLVTVDLNPDGFLDVVVRCGWNDPNDALWVLDGRGDGTFAPRVLWEGDLHGTPRALARGDLNGDGYLDLVAAGKLGALELAEPSATVFLAKGDGSFSSVNEIALGPNVEDVLLADFDGDGALDLAVGAHDGGETRISRGRGDGTFEAAAAFRGGNPRKLAAADVNGDGVTDLCLFGGTVYALPNRGGGTRFVRGDANADGKTNIGDAVFVLGYLFARGAVPACLDSADGNDDGSVGIADAIRILGHLFAGTGPLPAPFDACGEDATGTDPLGCASFAPCK